MTLTAESGSGCHLQKTYTLQTDKGINTLVWLPNLKLVKEHNYIQTDKLIKFELINIDYDVQKLSLEFSKRSKYASTDYADIGDSESDPFIRKMINLGFVEHGASGFYDANGDQIHGEHGSH